jgi:hypothetical protein
VRRAIQIPAQVARPGETVMNEMYWFHDPNEPLATFETNLRR